MESNLKIPTLDRKVIYGRLRGPITQALVIFVHGLGGRMDQHIFYNGARFLEKHNISSLRFNLYSWEKNARNLSDCTIETHSNDLDTVISYCKKQGTKKIFVVGHSFGGPTILFSRNKDFNGVILWDPSYADLQSFKNAEYVDCLDMYKGKWEFEVLFNKAMVEEEKTLKEREETAIQKIKVPVKIISAGDGMLIDGGKRYFELANKPKEHVTLEGAGHTFDEDGIEEKLFNETLYWINSHS